MKPRNWALTRSGIGGILLGSGLYLCFWPTPLDPVSWRAPPNPKAAAPFQLNSALTHAESVNITPYKGPESLAIDSNGRLYTGVEGGFILRFKPGQTPTTFAKLPAGRPLGLAFDVADQLYVAHAPAGLLRVSPDGQVEHVLSTVNGQAIRFADDLDIARDGTIYLSDATTKFDPSRHGGAYATSRLEMLEHRGNGRLIAFDPRTNQARIIAEGIHFANGVTVSHDQKSVLVVETASYRVLRFDRANIDAQPTVFAGPFPGFPDNIYRGKNGRYWIGLVSPRNTLLDALDGSPRLRKVAYRLPYILQPKPRAYGFILSLDKDGKVIRTFQDPSGRKAFTVGAIEHDETLWVSCLKGESLYALHNWRALATGLEK